MARRRSWRWPTTSGSPSASSALRAKAGRSCTAAISASWSRTSPARASTTGWPGNFLKYAGPLTANDLPVDAHELIALCAPRPVFISCGGTHGGVPRARWVDAKGMFLAGRARRARVPAARQEGSGDQRIPAGRTTLIDGEMAFRQHSGGHTHGPELADVPDLRRTLLHAGREAAEGAEAGEDELTPSPRGGRLHVDCLHGAGSLLLLGAARCAPGSPSTPRPPRSSSSATTRSTPASRARPGRSRWMKRSASAGSTASDAAWTPTATPFASPAPQGQPLEPRQRRQGRGADRGGGGCGRPASRPLRRAVPGRRAGRPTRTGRARSRRPRRDLQGDTGGVDLVFEPAAGLPAHGHLVRRERGQADTQAKRLQRLIEASAERRIIGPTGKPSEAADDRRRRVRGAAGPAVGSHRRPRGAVADPGLALLRFATHSVASNY